MAVRFLTKKQKTESHVRLILNHQPPVSFVLAGKSMKNVILNKNGQISLICFFSILIIQPTILSLVKLGVTPSVLSIVGYILTFPLLGASIFFGIKQLSKSKFTLFWLIPAIIYALLFIVALGYSLFSKGEIIHPPKKKIGVSLDRTSEGKIQIIAVFYKSKAAKAGIKSGDIITKINDENIDDEDVIEVVSLIGASNNGELKIEIERDGNKKNFNIDRTVNNNDALNAHYSRK
jgi:PDZ domain